MGLDGNVAIAKKKKLQNIDGTCIMRNNAYT